MNNNIIRTRKFSKLKIPFLKIISLSSNEKFNNIEKKLIKSTTRKDMDNNIPKIIKNNKNEYKNENKYESKLKNKKKAKYEKNINSEEIKLKSIISNNFLVVPKKFENISSKKKMMKDGQTNTEPIIEEAYILSSDKVYNNSNNINNNQNNINFNNNNNENNITNIKREKSIEELTNKKMSLKKKLKSSPNYFIPLDKTLIQNLNIMQKSWNNNKILENNNFHTFLKNPQIHNEENKINYNIISEKERIKNNKKYVNSTNDSNKKKNHSIKKKNYQENYNLSFKDNKNFDKIYKIKYRNKIIPNNISKSNNDMERQYNNHHFNKNILNKKYYFDKLFFINNTNSKDMTNEELKINSLIKSEKIQKNKKKLPSSNRLYHLGKKNIKFSPCRYNLFNVPIIENNYSLEETIKQQTVSNFNNKYNLKFKTKNPKEKEKIKTLFNLLKKNKNIDFEKRIHLQKFNSMINKYRNDNNEYKQVKRPKTVKINKMRINKFFDNKKLNNFINKNLLI